MSEPRQTCTTCGDVEVVKPDGRGFPPDIAKRRLAKRCKAKGHASDPAYRAGMSVQLEELIGRKCLLCSAHGTHRFAAAGGPQGWLCETHKDEPVNEFSQTERS